MNDNVIFIDLETLPIRSDDKILGINAHISDLETESDWLRASIEVADPSTPPSYSKVAHLKDPVKIKNKIVLDGENRLNEIELEISKAKSYANKELRKTSTDVNKCIVFSIGMAIGDYEPFVYVNDKGTPEGEREIFEKFDKFMKKFTFIGAEFVGFNIKRFDLPIMHHRLAKHGLDYHKIPFTRARAGQVHDLHEIWQGFNYMGFTPFKDVCDCLGIKSKNGFDGSMVYDAFLNGEIDKIIKYNKEEIENIREVAKMIGEYIPMDYGLNDTSLSRVGFA